MLEKTCPYKLLIVSPSYLKGMQIYQLCPWEQLDCTAMLEVNLSSCMRKIVSLRPDIIITHGDTGWVELSYLTQVAYQTGKYTQIILLGTAENAVQELAANIQVLDWRELDQEQMCAAVRSAQKRIAEGIAAFTRDSSGKSRTDNEQLMETAAKLDANQYTIVRFQMERHSDKNDEHIKHTIKKYVEKIGGDCFQETNRNYCILLNIPEMTSLEHLNVLEKELLLLKQELSNLTGGTVFVFSGRQVSLPELTKEYQHIKQLEKYRFFFADVPIVSDVTCLQRQPVSVESLDWAAIRDCTEALLCAVVKGDNRETEILLRKLFLDYIKPSCSEACCWAVWTQIQNIYEQVSYLWRIPAEYASEQKQSFWVLEQAMVYQIEQFQRLIQKRGITVEEMNPLVLQALMLIIHAQQGTLYVGEIAKRLGTSESYLSRVFKQHMGTGIVECMRYIRIYSAVADIVQGERSIKHLAKAHGFVDPKYFSKVFRQIVGVNPSAYIEQFTDKVCNAADAERDAVTEEKEATV